MFETSSSKNLLAKKFHKLTTRSRSGSQLSYHSSAHSMPPSPTTDYFSEPPIASRSRSGSGFTAPLTPITPTGLAGGAIGDSLNLSTVVSAPPGAGPDQCAECKPTNSSFVDAQSACTCKGSTQNDDEVPGAQEETAADEMAQQILRRVSQDATQGWTI